jgi:Transposase DDE domain
MSRHTPLDSWIRQVVSAFACLTRPQATVLALYTFGAILAQRCGLNSVAAMLVRFLGVGYLTIRSRLQEFYQPASAKSGTQRRELDVTTCFAPLLAWVLKGWPSNRLALALDATSLGDRFTALSISVVSRGSACPVAWKIMQANVQHAWKPEWIALLRLVHPLVPARWTVIVMTDRGLYARWLYQEIVALGWHPLMRITRLSKFRQSGSRSSLPVTAFVPKAGQRWQGRGVAFPRKPSRRLDCTLLACWEPGHEEPWFVLTDLEPDQSESLWYGMRAWIEHGFKLLKSQGWQWQKSRMTDPDRASRLWLVLAVATRYVLAAGGEADAADVPVETVPEMAPTSRTARAVGRAAGAGRSAQARRPVARLVPSSRVPGKRASGTKERLVSVFRQGLAVLVAILIAGHALPKPPWKPEPWLEIRANFRTCPDQPPTPVPKSPSL